MSESTKCVVLLSTLALPLLVALEALRQVLVCHDLPRAGLTAVIGTVGFVLAMWATRPGSRFSVW